MLLRRLVDWDRRVPKIVSERSPRAVGFVPKMTDSGSGGLEGLLVYP